MAEIFLSRKTIRIAFDNKTFYSFDEYEFLEGIDVQKYSLDFEIFDRNL